MNTRRWAAALLFLAVGALSALAQSDAEGETVFAPFPSRIRAAVRGGAVILTWIDSTDLKASYAVYRSESPVETESFDATKRLGTVPPGVQSYSDVPPDYKTYYYAVAALAEDGTPYRVVIPAKNATISGVSLPLPPAAAVAAEPQQPPSPPPPFVSDIGAKAAADSIVISYKTSPKSRLVLYRGSSPIAVAADLLDATLVAAFSDRNGSFTDYPVPGVDYYYALLGEEDLKAGNIDLVPGINSLKNPVQVRARAVSSGFTETQTMARTPPLPYFLPEDSGLGNASASLDDSAPPSRAVSPETSKAISVLLAKAPTTLKAKPAADLLPEEKAPPTGGEDYALSLIAKEKILGKDWPGAIDQLRKYLSLNRTPRAAARARFYLGEALASAGTMQDAFFEFISARDFYPVQSKAWIDYVLSSLAAD